MLVKGILRGHDKLLAPYLKEYQKAFTEIGFDLADFIEEIKTHANRNILIRLKWKLRLKSRIKKLLYELAEKL